MANKIQQVSKKEMIQKIKKVPVKPTQDEKLKKAQEKARKKAISLVVKAGRALRAAYAKLNKAGMHEERIGEDIGTSLRHIRDILLRAGKEL